MICPICLGSNILPFKTIDKKNYFKCNFCSGLFVDSKHHLSSEEEKERYSLHNNTLYDPDYRIFLSKLYNPLVAELKKGSKGLDFGCGPGPALAEMFKEAGFCMDLYDPIFFPQKPSTYKKYDFITCTEVVEHFYDPFNEFIKIDGMLAKKGIFAVMTNFYDESINFENWYYRKDPTHVVFYTIQTLQYIAEEMSWKFETPSKNVVFFKK